MGMPADPDFMCKLDRIGWPGVSGQVESEHVRVREGKGYRETPFRHHYEDEWSPSIPGWPPVVFVRCPEFGKTGNIPVEI